MLHTNLLPEPQWRIIILGQWTRIVRLFGITAIVALLIGITLLAPSYLPLFFQNRELERSLLVHTQTAGRINADTISADAARINAIIESLRRVAAKPRTALDLFDLLSDPHTGITVSSFTIDASGDIILTGHAATRGNLLDFEQFLRDSSTFQNLASPLANIIQETDINFNFKATLKSALSL